MESPDPIVEEEKKMRRLRIMVDLVAAVLAQERMTMDEALDLVNATKRAALNLFPGKGDTFDIIYGRRFARILKERFAFAKLEQQRNEGEASPSF
ncbi:hypothetical protein HZA56_07700 [Candidatus Poribacteria bacterium]|nr:hypothetical protein [Candidatus Poribacteria bacterium]